MSLLRTENLSVQIGHTRVCKNLSIELKAGEVWGMLGRNGMGKTTLLHTLAGLREPHQGDIFIQQRSLHSLRRKQLAQRLGLLLQQQEDSFPSRVIDTVISGRHPHLSQWQWESAQDWQIAQQALQQLQLSHLAQRPINQLSGGERQRVAMATLITQDPAIMLLDEPSSHLDLKHQIQLLDFIRKQTISQHKTTLMTLHDVNLSARYCDKLILLLGDTHVMVGDTSELLNEENLQCLYDYPIKKIDTEGFPLFIADTL